MNSSLSVPSLQEFEYQDFLESKRVLAPACGFEVNDEDISLIFSGDHEFQRDIVKWDLRRGKAANFLHTGLGKGPIQMEWCKHVCRYTGGDTLIMAPLAVAEQFTREAVKFGYSVTLCQSQDDVRPGINVTNYERMEKFDLSSFSGVAMDESGCLKSWNSKTTKYLTDALKNTRFKLCSSATPSPNDHAELGTHAEILDVMTRAQMLAMFFEHDGGETSKWTLKGHGKKPFWKFCASWAVCVRLPSDLGYDDSGYVLPELRMHEHIVRVDHSIATEGMLFRVPDMSATGLHKEMRLTAKDRAEKVAGLVMEKPLEQWIIWCNTNYEADAVRKALDGVVEVRGSDPAKKKVAVICGFLDGLVKWMLSKGALFGFGLNLQCCHNMIFMGLSYSFETLFQCIRRCLRYGQIFPVDCHIVIAETEGPVLRVIRIKERQYEELQSEMNEAMREEQLLARHKATKYEHLMPLEVPAWL